MEWLTKAQMGLLFERDYKTVSKHILNAFKEGELERDSVLAKFATTQRYSKIKYVQILHMLPPAAKKQLPQNLRQFKWW